MAAALTAAMDVSKPMMAGPAIKNSKVKASAVTSDQKAL